MPHVQGAGDVRRRDDDGERLTVIGPAVKVAALIPELQPFRLSLVLVVLFGEFSWHQLVPASVTGKRRLRMAGFGARQEFSLFTSTCFALAKMPRSLSCSRSTQSINSSFSMI